MKFEYLIYLLPIIFIIGATSSKPKKIAQKKKIDLQPGDIVEGPPCYPYYGASGGFTYMRFPKNFSQLGDSLRRFFLPKGFNLTAGSVIYWILISALLVMISAVIIDEGNNNTLLILVFIIMIRPISIMIGSGKEESQKTSSNFCNYAEP